jgi:hypothetical protein
MKRLLIALTLVAAGAFTTITVLAVCGSYFQPAQSDTFAGGPCPNAFSKTAYWTIYWTDGHVTTPPVQVTASGSCFGPENGVFQACYPGFDEPYFAISSLGLWDQVTHDPSHAGPGQPCQYDGIPTHDHWFTYLCKAHCRGATDWTNYYTTGCITGFIDGGGTCGRSSAFQNQCYRFGDYEDETCSCSGGCEDPGSCSPIVIDTAGNGFDLTSAKNGPMFDITGFGEIPGFAPIHHIGWTSANSDDGWLVLDLNGNGVIDNGMELFGTASPQPGPERNGFLALAQYDRPVKGGNGDGTISDQDAVFSSLRIWIDGNHNGISEPSELVTLASLGIGKFELDYKESKRIDRYGNQFRYRAKVKDVDGAQLGRWAWDIIPATAP